MQFREYLELHPRQRGLPKDWARSNYRKYLKRHGLVEAFETRDVRWAGKSDKTKPFHLYRLFKDDKLVYIGFTTNPRHRYGAHKRQKDFDYMGVFASYESKAAALLAEYIQIMKYKPTLNIAYLNGSPCPVKIVKWEPYERGGTE